MLLILLIGITATLGLERSGLDHLSSHRRATVFHLGRLVEVVGVWVVLLGGPHRYRKHLAAGALGSLPEWQGYPMVGRSVLGSGPASFRCG